MAATRPGAASTDVTVRGLSKAFSGTAALEGVDLAVRPGELLALLGPSGSGKTTLLRVIAGLEVPDRGEVLFGGEDVTDAPVQERGIGFVFQHYALFRHLTVHDNIAYGPRSRRRGKPSNAVLKARVEELLALVQLEGYGHRFPAQLSGGQRQRVALARALATDPRVLLLDEPFGALDAQVRKDLRRWLRDIHRETGQTTIFVTHDQDEAMELADRVAILHRGRLEQVGTPDEVYDTPESGFVMSFVGESSAIPIEVARGAAFCAGRPLSVPVTGAADGSATLHVRPQAFRLLGEREDGLHGTVVAIRRAGRSRLAEILLTGPSVVVEVEDTHHALGIDDDVSLGIEEGKVFGAG